MNDDEFTPAVNPLPPAVVALVIVIMGIELAFTLGARGLVGDAGAVGWRLAAIQAYAFSGDIFDWMRQTGRWPPEHLLRFASYPFVHASFTHALFVSVFVLALGKLVAEVFGGLAMLAVFVISAAAGALVYGLVLNDPVPLLGGFPAAYGLIGAFTFLLWARLSLVGENQARAFVLIAVLMGFQLVLGLLFGGSRDWVADLTGFATGFAISFFLVPGGWTRIRDRIRHD